MIVKVTVIKVHERRVPITIYFRYLVISIAFPIPVCDRRASAREGNSDLWTYDGGATMRSSITDVVRDIGKGSVGTFAEIYYAPERTVKYGLDASIVSDDDKMVTKQ